MRALSTSHVKTLLVLVLISLLVTACGKSSPKLTYKGTLTLWYSPGLAGFPGRKAAPDGAWFAERAKAFTAVHPGITVDLQELSNPAALERALTTNDPQGRPAPDLAFGRFLPSLAPRLADISGVLGKERAEQYHPGALDGFRVAGQLRGIPTLLEVQVLALNERAFAEAGADLPAGGNWTVDEFEAALRKLSGSGRHALGFYHLPGYREWWPLAAGLFAPDGTVAKGAPSALEKLVSYRKDGLLHPDTAKISAKETWALFARQPAAFAIMPVGAYALPLLREQPYNVKLAAAGFPGGVNAGTAYGFSFFQTPDKAKLEAAISLAAYMGVPDQQVRLARQTGLVPAAKTAANPFEGDPLLTRAYQEAARFQPLPAGPDWDQAEQAVSRDLLYVLLGVGPVRPTLEEISAATLKAMTPPR